MKILLASVTLAAAVYLLWPTSGFPPPPNGVLISLEPADTESIYRKAYYTRLTRDEVINYYQGQWRWPFIRLIVPPEDAGAVIRDQTRGSWLEEFVHPLKDSLYVNGFYPTKPTEQINLAGTHWEGKITVRYLPSHPVTRLTVLLLAAISAYLLVKEYAQI